MHARMQQSQPSQPPLEQELAAARVEIASMHIELAHIQNKLLEMLASMDRAGYGV